MKEAQAIHILTGTQYTVEIWETFVYLVESMRIIDRIHFNQYFQTL